MRDHVIRGGGAGGIDRFRRQVDAHAQEARDDSVGAGGAVGQAGETAVLALEAADQIDRAGEGVFLVIHGPVEVKEDGGEVVEVWVHGASVVVWEVMSSRGKIARGAT